MCSGPCVDGTVSSAFASRMRVCQRASASRDRSTSRSIVSVLDTQNDRNGAENVNRTAIACGVSVSGNDAAGPFGSVNVRAR